MVAITLLAVWQKHSTSTTTEYTINNSILCGLCTVEILRMLPTM